MQDIRAGKVITQGGKADKDWKESDLQHKHTVNFKIKQEVSKVSGCETKKHDLGLGAGHDKCRVQ